MNQQEVNRLKDVATKLRIHSVESTTAAGSGHPTSCSSMAEIMSALFFKVMKYSISDPRGAANDRFILSKGHAAPILYAAWAEAGLFDTSELLKLRKMDCDLEGHPTPRLSFVDVATGSLGQGLGVACGMAYVGKYLDKSTYRTFCLMGDGESMEGSVWEAFNFASFYKLDNLVAIIDVNRLGQSDEAPLGHDMETHRKRVESFGFHAIVVDGHDIVELLKAFKEAEQTKGKPTCIIAKTFKGNDFPSISNELNWHGKALGAKTEEVLKALRPTLGQSDGVNPPVPGVTAKVPSLNIASVQLCEAPSYKMGEKVSTRKAYGTALVKIAKTNDRVVALDGDVKNSTFSLDLRKVMPSNHIECFICEQNLAGVGIGVACRDRTIAFVSTFACFLSRAYDSFRMGVISQTNLNVAGSHCGVSIGEDGPSQMALEDLAMFRALPGCTVFYPSDGVSAERAIELAAQTKGITYTRTSRPDVPVIYSGNTEFKIGKAHVVKQSGSDKLLIIGSCVTLHNALTAAEELAGAGLNVRVMDPFTIKPIDKEGIIKNALECGGKILTVEDHYPEGGLGDAVLDAVAGVKDIVVKKVAIMEVPRSGPPAVLMERYGIGPMAIVNHVKQFLNM